MIKIFSIQEVIQASNNILSRSKKKSNSKNKIKPLILTEEFSEDKNIKEKKLNQKNEGNEKKITTYEKKVIDQIYLKLKKKIKKNTLKLIFELQEEVSNLNKLKGLLQISNKKLENQISKVNSEFKIVDHLNKNLAEDKILLNQKINKLTKILDTSKNEVETLKNNRSRLESALKDNSFLKEEITKLNKNLKTSKEEVNSLIMSKVGLEKQISKLKNENEKIKQKIYDVTQVENKNKFFQEENLRIGSELLEIKRKHDILKNEIEKYENQKSKLISKINSVNEALSETNILTNVFENKVQNKVKVIDHNKIEKQNSSDLDEQIKSIFSEKN